MQTKLPTSKIPECLGATLRASVRTEKTKSPGGRVGLSAHVKMRNRLHKEKEATCSPELQSWRRLLLSLLPTASIRTSIQRTGVQTVCRWQGSQKQHTCKQRTYKAFHMQTKLPTLIRANARIIADAMQTSGENQDK